MFEIYYDSLEISVNPQFEVYIIYANLFAYGY